MFANNYLLKNGRFPLIKSVPNADCEIIVVIPCLNEPEILETLRSLSLCNLPRSKVEIIILINHSEMAPDEIKRVNKKTKIEVEEWILNNRNTGIFVFAIGPVELKSKWAGAGLARKTGMDEAVLRFNMLNKPDGIIVSLDADTLVEQNYLVEIENHFEQNPKDVGATISFQHRIDGLSEKHLKGIQLYEKFLAYYKNALQFTGYPYSMFTIGSAFAVRAGAYVKRGGMNRRQAGEDFYFLQNLVQVGHVGEINTTKVYPSARLSNRVPFGTGPVLQKWMNDEADLTKTYNLQAFIDLKLFFDNLEKLFQVNKQVYEELVNGLPEAVKRFLLQDNFWNEIDNLNRNCATLHTFHERFFHRFNAFRILKFMNFAHDKYYIKTDLCEEALILEKLTKK